jgi:hypothetical protein
VPTNGRSQQSSKRAWERPPRAERARPAGLLAYAE